MAEKNNDLSKMNIWRLVVSVIVAVALVSYALYLLVGLYSDVLITAQDRNLYSGDSMFFSQQIACPFGLLQYVGGFLTQMFYYPVLGVCLLIAIWLASFFVGVKAFRLKGLWRSLMIVPMACLLASELDLGYWVYCLTIPGYWFSQSVAFLCLMLLVWAANSTPRRYRIAWYVVVGFVLFPFFGWISYMFVVCLALSQFAKNENGKTTPSWIDGVGIILAFVLPLIFRALLYEKIPFDDVFSAGFPLFKTSTNSSLRPVVPFFILTGTTVFLALGRVLPSWKKIPACIAYLVVGIVSSVFVWSSIFKDDNYLYEMQMAQATMSEDWQGVISVAEKTKTPSRTMVMLKNVALLNTGQLGDRSFELSNDGIEINNPDTLNINIMHIAAPLIYYNHGLVNYASRWCIEFAIPYGFSPYYLKMLARCAEASGEKRLARRYIGRLHSMLFYKDWQPAPDSRIVNELKSIYPDALDNDENSCERYIISHFSKQHYVKSPRYCELSLLYSMIMRDPNNFWTSFYDYILTHKGAKIPTSYEEAYCVFMDQAPVNFPLKVSVSPTTTERYKQFWDVGNGYAQSGMTEDAVRDAMLQDWGATYWWFNAFGRSAY